MLFAADGVEVSFDMIAYKYWISWIDGSRLISIVSNRCGIFSFKKVESFIGTITKTFGLEECA
jgi:hypothetical protein